MAEYPNIHHITVLKSHFNSSSGGELNLIHYALEVTLVLKPVKTACIMEYGRYDGTNGKYRVRIGRKPNEVPVTNFSVQPEQLKQLVAEFKQASIGDWSIFHNCVTIVMSSIRRYGTAQNVREAKEGEDNHLRVLKELCKNIKWELE